MVDEEAEYAYNNIKTKYIYPFTFAHLIFFSKAKILKIFQDKQLFQRKSEIQTSSSFETMKILYRLSISSLVSQLHTLFLHIAYLVY